MRGAQSRGPEAEGGDGAVALGFDTGPITDRRTIR